MAVRHHHRLSLPLRADHHRPVGDRRRLPQRLGAHPQAGVPPAHQVAGQAVHHQLRPRSRHRHRPGVPVRDELVGLLAVRRRHLRRPAGVRGAAGVLPRVDLPRPVDLRLGPDPREAARVDHVDRAHRHRAVGVLHPRRELVHAEPRRLPVQPRVGARRDGRLRRGAGQQGPARDLPARHPQLLHDRRRRRRRRGAVALAAQGPDRRP